MSTRSRRGYNRRALDRVRYEGSAVAAITEVTFDTDGTDGLVILAIGGPATIIATSTPADLDQWQLWAYRNGVSPVSFVPVALEILSPNANGARCQLRFTQHVSYAPGTWKLIIPANTRHIRAANGSPLSGYRDPQHVVPPAPELPYSLTCAGFSNPAGVNWTISSVTAPGAGVLNVDTGNAGNSPFTDLAASGWTVSGGVTVSSVADLGAGILELTLSGGGGAGTMVGVANDGGPTSAYGFAGAASFAVVP